MVTVSVPQMLPNVYPPPFQLNETPRIKKVPDDGANPVYVATSAGFETDMLLYGENKL
jgi:hypothetical protein